MTCTEFLQILDDVIDQSIAAETRAEIEAHLKKCGHCEVVLNTTRKTIEIFRCHEIYEVPAEVSQRLHTKIMDRCKKAR
ncbi:MAG TPA: zf-HC2 domain-containing protein [Terracidiphilus sp.]|jgi:anti-sigma factor RsiW